MNSKLISVIGVVFLALLDCVPASAQADQPSGSLATRSSWKATYTLFPTQQICGQSDIEAPADGRLRTRKTLWDSVHSNVNWRSA